MKDFSSVPGLSFLLPFLLSVLALGCAGPARKVDQKGCVCFHPIGVIHSPYTPETGAPRQGRFRPDVPATIEIFPEYEKGLTDIRSFSHIFVLFLFDRAKGWRPMVKTPWDKTLHGVFTTRSFRRPNPIGLTAVRLVKREGRILHVRGIDAFDGTPVLDIKPYVPRVDSIPEASIGWLKRGRPLPKERGSKR